MIELRTVRIVRAARLFIAQSINPGRIIHGEDFIVGPGLRVSRGATLVAGSRVSIGLDALVMANVRLGNDIMISARVGFIGNDHPFDETDKLITEYVVNPPAKIVLEGDNLIGFGTIIMGDVRIGRGAVVGAGSLVMHDIPQDAICVGIPARPVRYRR